MPFGRLERRAPPRPFSDINMTPLIDVMLVLLVIFIVTAPLLAARLPLDLPSSATAEPSPVAASLTVSLAADGTLSVNDEVLPGPSWRDRLAEAARRDPGTELHLRADERVPYGRVAEVLEAARQAGFARIGFAVESTPAR